MRPYSLATVAMLAMALVPGVAQAQRGRVHAQESASCPVDTAAAWYKKQRQWNDESQQHWTDDAFRQELLRGAGLTVEQALDVHPGFELVGTGAPAADESQAPVLDRLRALTKNRQSIWPTRSVVGAAGVRAVWNLSARDTLLSVVTLHRMMEAGPDESPPAAVAVMDDRLRIRAGRKQIYATQLVVGANGDLVPAPTEDLPHVELRREAAGLPPLSTSLCLAKKH
ncbi:MAG: hypothetical protein U0132_04440 [Gemmatimonadaceae bacterium]